jgi:hypothetical protein
MSIGNSAEQAAVLDMAPLHYALHLKPCIERLEIGEAGPRGSQGLPQPAPCLLYVLLNLTVLPCGQAFGSSQPDAGLQNSGSNRRSQIFCRLL